MQEALGNLVQGRTVLVIAHRLGTIRRANRIAVLEDGRITAIGSHDELLAELRPPINGCINCSSWTCPNRALSSNSSRMPDRTPRSFWSRRSQGRQRNSTMPIYSMTGFARVQVRVPVRDHDQLSYTLTVKSVNHRFLDVQLRLPPGLDALEMELRRHPEGAPGPRPRGTDAFRRSQRRSRWPVTIATWSPATWRLSMRRAMSIGLQRAAGSECDSASARRAASRQSRQWRRGSHGAGRERAAADCSPARTS